MKFTLLFFISAAVVACIFSSPVPEEAPVEEADVAVNDDAPAALAIEAPLRSKRSPSPRYAPSEEDDESDSYEAPRRRGGKKRHGGRRAGGVKGRCYPYCTGYLPSSPAYGYMPYGAPYVYGK